MLKLAFVSGLLVAGFVPAQAAIAHAEQTQVRQTTNPLKTDQKRDSIITGRTLDPEVHKKWLEAHKKRQNCTKCFEAQPYPGDLPDQD